MPEPWKVVASRITYRDRWLTVRSDDCVTAAGLLVAPYHVLEFPTWVNVVALTAAGEIVLVREYRHGAGRVLVNLPGGVMDPGESDGEAAARRELREETGHTSGAFYPLGASYANPANQDNLVRSYLAVGVEPTEAPSPEPSEEIEVFREGFAAFAGRLRRREESIQVSHAAAVLAATLDILAGAAPAPAGVREALLADLLGPGGPML